MSAGTTLTQTLEFAIKGTHHTYQHDVLATVVLNRSRGIQLYLPSDLLGSSVNPSVTSPAWTSHLGQQ